MVKHAADTQHPLLNAAERVERRICGDYCKADFHKWQRQWLERIRVHLQENLSIDQEDFESQPVFTDYGGWSRAFKDFEGHLPMLVKEINRAIAA